MAISVQVLFFGREGPSLVSSMVSLILIISPIRVLVSLCEMTLTNAYWF